MAPKLNIIFLGDFPYPYGMAGTKRIQHAIDGLKGKKEISICVIVLTQSSRNNVLNGAHLGTPYQTVVGDLLRSRMALLFPVLYLKAMRTLKRTHRSDCSNIIYNYGPLNLFNVVPLAYAQRCGYKIVFDIVEDDDTAMENSRSIYHKIKTIGVRYLKKYTKHLASGVIVISSHLDQKYRELTHGMVPIHFRPISVDFSRVAKPKDPFGPVVTLFYAGSFGKKDGLFVLLDAYDSIAARRSNVRLVLTGKGSDEMVRLTFARIEASPFKERIEYKGYLDDADYYATLNAVDIPCMTRIDSAFAQAGFPFKLGEFLATGKPVIASRVSDVANTLKDGGEVLLVEPGESNAIVQAVEYLLDNPDKARVLGLCGRTAAERLFDFRVQGRALLSFLRCL